MQNLLILLTIATQICFASPFDFADEDYEELYQSQEIPSETVKHEVIIDEVMIEPEKIQPFVERNKAKFILINIKNGNKKEFTLAVRERISIEDIDIQLQSCSLEKDEFYNPISIAQLLVNNKYITSSSDFNLGNVEIKDKLLAVYCHDK
jgi:hypothetical protein